VLLLLLLLLPLLLVQAKMRGVSMGSMWLAASGSQKTETCLQLLQSRTGATGELLAAICEVEIMQRSQSDDTPCHLSSCESFVLGISSAVVCAVCC
jgi:hypothetical protein